MTGPWARGAPMNSGWSSSREITTLLKGSAVALAVDLVLNSTASVSASMKANLFMAMGAPILIRYRIGITSAGATRASVQRKRRLDLVVVFSLLYVVIPT